MSKLIKVCGLGSCRIRGPMRHLQGTGQIYAMDRSAIWFTHSTRDALQKIEIVTGERPLTPEQVPLIVRGTNHYRPETHNPAFYLNTDCLVVEISSIKCVKYNGLDIQLVCLSELLRAEEIDIPEFLHQLSCPRSERDLSFLPAKTSALARDMAAQATMILQTPEEIEADLSALREKMNHTSLVLVSHVHMKNKNGEMIPMRALIQKTLSRFCRKNGIVFFDPTPIARRYGLDKALISLSHYSPAFVPHLAEHLYKAIQTAHAGHHIQRTGLLY